MDTTREERRKVGAGLLGTVLTGYKVSVLSKEN